MYRGSVGPIQPYAFTSTPSLNQTTQWQPPAGSYRTSSTSSVPTLQTFDPSHYGARSSYLASASMTNLPTTSNLGLSVGGSRDDSSLVGTATRRTAPGARPQSALLSGPTLSPTGTSFTMPQGTPAKPSPERYRRPAARSADASASAYRVSTQNRRNSTVGSVSSSGTEESQINGSYSAEEAAARRVRRRSLPALDSAAFPQPRPLTPHDVGRQPEESSRLELPSSPRPKSAGKEQQQQKTVARIGADEKITKPVHARAGSSDSRVSTRSNNSRPSSVSSIVPYWPVRSFGPLDPSIIRLSPFIWLQNRQMFCTTSNHAQLPDISDSLSPNPPCQMQSLMIPFPVCEPQRQCISPHRKPRLSAFSQLCSKPSRLGLQTGEYSSSQLVVRCRRDNKAGCHSVSALEAGDDGRRGTKCCSPCH